MIKSFNSRDFGPAVAVVPASEHSDAIVVCEHASNILPPFIEAKGLYTHLLTSHVAWDPGAFEVASALAKELGAIFIYGQLSRLIYDCNRPPDAADAIPAKSEVYDIPFNQNLSVHEKEERIQCVYNVFSERLREEISFQRAHLNLLTTIHSFTPIFHGQTRPFQIGILHGNDSRLAEAMMTQIPKKCPYEVRLNAPYSAADGVTHTLDLHGDGNQLPSVMIEIRNDLITTLEGQRAMAKLLAPWILAARAQLLATEDGL